MGMVLECPHCRRELPSSAEAVRFCAFCGQALRRESSGSPDPARPADESTLLQDYAQQHEQKTLDFDHFTASTPRARAEAAPKEIGGYRLLRRLGGGGMGTVYEAEHLGTGRRMALKLINRDFASNQDALARFRQEGRLASQLSHPRCVFVRAVDEEAGRPYIVMELMPGNTLADLVRQHGPLEPSDAVTKIADVLDGLAEAHRLGLVHRDIKPSNCFLERNGRVKIGDFGLAKSLGATNDLISGSDDKGGNLTRTGAFLGTPMYASPEQVKGEKVDQQADVYAICATLYFLLTGKAPFEGSGDALAVMARIVADDPKPMRELRPEIPARLDQVVLKGLARDRRQRWQNVNALRQALAPFLPRRFGYVGLGLRAAALIVDSVIIVIGQQLIEGAVSFAKGTFGETKELADVLQAFSMSSFLLHGILLGFAVSAAYFFVFEALLGRTPGKWILGLRVVTSSGNRVGLGRLLIRTLVFVGIYSVFQLLFLLSGLQPVMTDEEIARIAALPPDQLATTLAGYVFYVGVVLPIISSVFGACLVCCTMRQRNGYRGLHEIASGTRVATLRVDWLLRKSKRVLEASDLPVETGNHVPTAVGPFLVRGRLGLSAGQELLVAHESSLDRMVWIWRRPSGTPQLSEARHELSREGRCRWLSGGQESDHDWDAFLASPGQLLVEAVAKQGPLNWSETRPLLERLVDELIHANADGTLPPTLSLAQLWLRSDGDFQLLDIALAQDSGPTYAMDLQGQRRFLFDFCCLCLEGQPRDAADVRALPRVALPLHVQDLIAHLIDKREADFDLTDFHLQLDSYADLPTQVGRSRRIIQVLVHGVVFMFVFPLVFVAASFRVYGPEVLSVRGEQQLQPSATATETAESTDNGNAHRSTAVASQGEDSTEITAEVGTSPPPEFAILVSLALILALAGWSVLQRGGVILATFGLALASNRGGRLARWRCGLRTLLAFSPVFLGLALVIQLESSSTGVHATVQKNAIAAAIGLYLLGLFVALCWKPQVTWYDLVVGGRVVPR